MQGVGQEHPGVVALQLIARALEVHQGVVGEIGQDAGEQTRRRRRADAASADDDDVDAKGLASELELREALVPALGKQALEGAGAAPIQNAFDVLGRISAEHPEEARPWIRSVLDQDVPGRALAALSAAKSVGLKTAHAVLGEVLAQALEREGTVEMAKQIEKDGIPNETVSLGEVRAWAIRKQLEALPKSEHEDVLKERAQFLHDFGRTQGSLGRWKDALASTRDAVEIRRKLALTRPDAFLPDFARSLNNRGDQERDLGLSNKAIDSYTEALDIIWDFFLRLPTAFEEQATTMLRNLLRSRQALGLPSTPDLEERLARLPTARPEP